MERYAAEDGHILDEANSFFAASNTDAAPAPIMTSPSFVSGLMPLAVKKTAATIRQPSHRKNGSDAEAHILKRDAGVGSNDVDWKRLNSNQAGTKKPFSCAMSVERKPFSR